MNQQEVISKIKEINLPFGEYMIIGGASLAVRDLRETKDLDILVLPERFEVLSTFYSFDKQYEAKWNRKRLKSDNIEIYPDLLLETKDIYFDVVELIKNVEVIDDIPLQPLDNLIICKQDSGREKDLADIKLIKTYIEERKND